MTHFSPSRLITAAATMAATVSNCDAVPSYGTPPWQPTIRSIRDTCRLPKPVPSPASANARCGALSLPRSFGRTISGETYALSCTSCSAGWKRVARQRSLRPASPILPLARVRGPDRWQASCPLLFRTKGRPHADRGEGSSHRRSTARVRGAVCRPGTRSGVSSRSW